MPPKRWRKGNGRSQDPEPKTKTITANLVNLSEGEGLGQPAVGGSRQRPQCAVGIDYRLCRRIRRAGQKRLHLAEAVAIMANAFGQGRRLFQKDDVAKWLARTTCPRSLRLCSLTE